MCMLNLESEDLFLLARVALFRGLEEIHLSSLWSNEYETTSNSQAPSLSFHSLTIVSFKLKLFNHGFFSFLFLESLRYHVSDTNLCFSD